VVVVGGWAAEEQTLAGRGAEASPPWQRRLLREGGVSSMVAASPSRGRRLLHGSGVSFAREAAAATGSATVGEGDLNGSS
jgi:hypothetical protein